jgi:hypothetical protein
MKTYFKYNGENIRIARDCGVTEDRFTEQQIIMALETGDAVRLREFIILKTESDKIMGVVEPKPVKTAAELTNEFDYVEFQYDNKVKEIKKRYDELVDDNQNLIMDYKGNLQLMVGGIRPLLVSDIMHGSDYSVEVLLKNIGIIETLLQNPRYYKPSKLIDGIKS